MRNLKILSIIAAVLACVLVFAACNGDTGVTTAPSGSGDSTTQAPTGATGEPEVTTTPAGGDATEPEGTEGTTGATDATDAPVTTDPSGTEPPATTQPPVATQPPATTAPQGGNEPTEIKYTVTVLDGDGKPAKNIIVELSNGKMASVNASGVATFTLPKGEYTVTVKDRSGKADYSDIVEKLTASKTSVTVTLLQKLTTPGGTLYNEEPYYEIAEGQFKIDVQKGKKTYLLFVPARSGIYEISVSGTNMVLGSYGSPAFILDFSTSDVVSNVWKMDVKRSNIGDNPPESTTKYLLGVHATSGSGTCTVSVKRIGDSVPTAADFPWEAAKADTKYLVKFDAPEGKVLTNIDINDGTVKIVKDAEGYYHYGSASGEYVMIRIDSETEYLASFVDICSSSPLGVHYYDANGKFLRKVQYNDMITEYATVCDKNGVCRLNDQLIDMVKEVGTYMGWWNPDSPNFRFAEYPYHKDVVWMFAFCYYA